jgi:hypothetical protein
MDNPYLQSQRAVWGKGYSDAADTRPIAQRWQREKSVKMMNSLKGKGAINPARDPFSGTSKAIRNSSREAVFKRQLSVENAGCKSAANPRPPEIAAPQAPLTSIQPGHISAEPKSMAIARFSLRFGP